MAVKSKKKKQKKEGDPRGKWTEIESRLVPGQFALQWKVCAPRETAEDKADSQCVTVHAHTALSTLSIFYAVRSMIVLLIDTQLL